MTDWLARFQQDLQIRNKSPRTIQAYSHHLKQFVKFHGGRSPEQLGPEEIRAFQVHLVQVRRLSWSSFNQTVCALRFLYQVTLPRPWPVTMIPFGKRPKKLPVVLAPEEVRRLLACCSARNVRTVLTTLYAAGLRMQEALHLKVTDIDSQRMLLTVLGKGNKQRQVPLSRQLLAELRDYWREYRPRDWLFPGQNPAQPLNPGTVQAACQKAVAAAGLTKRATPHSLRHSFATHCLEAGVDLLTISRLLGHSSFSTTLVYLHVRRAHLETVKSPYDWLPLEQCPRYQPPTSEPPPNVSPDTSPDTVRDHRPPSGPVSAD